VWVRRNYFSVILNSLLSVSKHLALSGYSCILSQHSTPLFNVLVRLKVDGWKRKGRHRWEDIDGLV